LDEKVFLEEYFDRYRKSLFGVDMSSQLIELRDWLKDTSTKGKKVIIAGNGGSAAIANHCATDFSKSAHIRCVNFNDPGLITCLANDYGYEHWVEKGLELYADDDDLIVLVSSSGKSANMLRAADYACLHAHRLVTFTGFSSENPLKARGNLNFWVNSRSYNIVEMTHQIWLLAVCDLIIGKAEYPAS